MFKSCEEFEENQLISFDQQALCAFSEHSFMNKFLSETDLTFLIDCYQFLMNLHILHMWRKQGYVHSVFRNDVAVLQT